MTPIFSREPKGTTLFGFEFAFDYWNFFSEFDSRISIFKFDFQGVMGSRVL